RYLDMPIMQVSSSAVRRRVAAGLPIRYLVPDKVASHIEANDLYRPAKPASPAPPTEVVA
ncbi:MAG: hypothetical protein ACRDSN_18870, partial [Pseudonocardiaceae bacterium]